MADTGMLDEPSLSRQWVARRLQRALALDATGAALRRGIARSAGTTGLEVRQHAAAAERRASAVTEAIREVGSEPYSSLRASRVLATVAGRVAGHLGVWAWRRPVLRLAAHTLSEYDALGALTQGAPGVPEGLAARLQAFLPDLEAEVERLGRR